MPLAIKASGVNATVAALDAIGAINMTQRPVIPIPS